VHKYSQLRGSGSGSSRKMKEERCRSRKDQVNWLLDFASRLTGQRRDYQVELYERMMYEMASEDFSVAYTNICTKYNIPTGPSEVKRCQAEANRREAEYLTVVI